MPRGGELPPRAPLGLRHQRPAPGSAGEAGCGKARCLTPERQRCALLSCGAGNAFPAPCRHGRSAPRPRLLSQPRAAGVCVRPLLSAPSGSPADTLIYSSQHRTNCAGAPRDPSGGSKSDGRAWGVSRAAGAGSKRQDSALWEATNYTSRYSISRKQTHLII